MGPLREPGTYLWLVFRGIWLILTFNMYCLWLEWVTVSRRTLALFMCRCTALCTLILHSPATFIFNKCTSLHWRWGVSIADRGVIGKCGARCNFTVKATHINASSPVATSAAAVLLKHIFKAQCFYYRLCSWVYIMWKVSDLRGCTSLLHSVLYSLGLLTLHLSTL